MSTVTHQTVARELDIDELRRQCDPGTLGFISTEEVAPPSAPIGQARAAEAVAFGLDAEMAGFNLFVTGPVGTGRRTSLEARLHEVARQRPDPGDWVYLHNFQDPTRPIAVGLPGGEAHALRADVARFLADARRELMAAFESSAYAQRQRALAEPLEREQAELIARLREQARESGVALELTPGGVVTAPLHGTRPMTPAEFSQLSDLERSRYQSTLERLTPTLQESFVRMRALQRDGRDRLRALEREVALFAIGHLVDELKERYVHSAAIGAWLDALAEDITENLAQLQGVSTTSELPEPLAAALGGSADQPLARYEVNAFVAHEADGGAPVVVEMNPTYLNLFGRIEHRGVIGGGAVTDHRMLRAGAVHRANGGYLLLPAAEVIGQPLLWLKLKSILRDSRIRLENPAEQFALIPFSTLTPEPIPLDVKVILIGSPRLYELAYALDEDLRKLFRVKVDFESRTRWDHDAELAYAAFLGDRAGEAGLRHFAADGVARVIEHGARLAGSRDWLSTSFGEIGALAAEASYWAGRDGSERVRAEDVERAIAAKIRRSDLLEQELLELLADGTLLLDLDGERVGQINGLAVLQLGDYAFGKPARITATAGPGHGALVSIEREAKLSGEIHDKGFLTLAGYLRHRYAGDHPLALSAAITFEQSYEHIDGDSASSAELYALLSALAGKPLRQDIAVTGSVDQHGEVQAIGGVNEKIEGFHGACRVRGLTGHQGVLIPAANVQHLMLAPDVIESVRAGAFHIWSARTIDEGIELLTGSAAGRVRDDGSYPAGSLHELVRTRLERWAELDRAKP